MGASPRRPPAVLGALVALVLASAPPPAEAQTRATDREPVPAAAERPAAPSDAERTAPPAGSVASPPSRPDPVGPAGDAELGAPRVVGPGSPASTARAAQAAGGDDPGMPTVMLVPAQTAAKLLQSGCWVRLYDGRDFSGDALTVAGPVELPSMDDRGGRAFKRRIDSMVVGPKATLTVFEHRQLKDRSSLFGPDSREAALARKLGFSGRIQSMRIDCAS